MTAFVDQFANEPDVLRRLLEAAVGPLPAVGPSDYPALDAEAHLGVARSALAGYLVALARRDEAVLLEHVSARGTDGGIEIRGVIPGGSSRLFEELAGIRNVSIDTAGDGCGDVDLDEGICILDAGHAGAHFHSMGKHS